jgi:drug/metabolite transporter (DMT)-like permease
VILLIRRASGRPVGRTLRSGGLARLLLLGVLGGPIFLFGLNTAVSHVGASISGLVTGLYAVFAAAIAPFVLKERLEMSALGGLALALIGTVMLAALDVGGVSAGGLGAGLGAAIGYAFYLVLGRKWMDAYSLAPDIVALTAATTTVLTFLAWVGVFHPEDLWPDSPRADALLALLWLGAVLAGGQTLVMMSARRIHSRRSAALLLLNPVTAAILGVVVLNESLTLPQTAGAGVVLTGLALGSGLGVSLTTRLWRSGEA